MCNKVYYIIEELCISEINRFNGGISVANQTPKKDNIPEKKAPAKKPSVKQPPKKQTAGKKAPVKKAPAKKTPAKKPAEPRQGGGMIAIIALIGIVAIVAASFVQYGLMGDSQAANSAPSLRITEVMASNASALIMDDGSLPDWVEIRNVSNKPVDLNGYGLMAATKLNQAFTFTHHMLQPGEYCVIYADGTGENSQFHAPFKIPASGETIALLDRSGDTVDMVVTPELGRDQSYALDGGSWKITDASTPGADNRIIDADEQTEEIAIAVRPGDLEISEIMSDSVTFFADESGEYHDYIEIHNKSAHAVNLAGWRLSDAKEKLMRWEFPSVNIPAGGYIAVHCSGYDRKSDANHLHTNFKLSSEGDVALLTSPEGVTVSMVTVPLLEADQAYSLTTGVWNKTMTPTPGAANAQESASSQADSVRANSGSGVYITEIMATATSNDWVEIYNGSNQPVDISGYGLSDNAGRPRKWQFPQGTTVQPGQYIGVIASGLDTVQNNNMHTNFRLSADGGYSITLSDPNGKILDRMFVPQQYTNVSYGRMDGQTGLRYFATATPGTANSGQSYMGRAAAPVYSVEGGLYKTGDVLTVEMSAPAGSSIYYTLDNTDPDQGDTLYTGPITVSETTILRTRVYCNGYMESFMDTQSYLYDVNNADGKVYVVSLVSDPYNLTSDEAGIMVKGPNATSKYPYGSLNNGANFWMDWEREGHVEVFNPDGSTMFSQGCGLKLHGQFSRAEKQQAFKIIARSEYGANRFPGALFSNRDYTEYQSFVVRSSGQDTDKSRMRDSILSGLAAGTSVMYQETELCVVYLDGQYWGQYNMRERINTTSICQFEGWEGDEDKLDLVKANTNVMQGSNETFEKLVEWCKKTNTNTDEAYAIIDSQIDIQNYIEYMAIQMYTGNTDTLNVKRYRNPNADGKWRWVIFDMDWAMNEDTNSVRRWLTPGGMGAGNRTDNTLFIACMKNAKFRDQFLTHLGQRMTDEFTADGLLAKFEARYRELEPLLPDQFAKWGPTESRFKSQMDHLIKYTKSRPYRMLQFLKYAEALNLSKAQMEHYFGGAMEKAGVTYEQIKKLS